MPRLHASHPWCATSAVDHAKSGATMSVLQELSDLRQRAVDRLTELEPLVAEYQQLQAVLAKLGTDDLPRGAAAAKPAGRRRSAAKAARKRATPARRASGGSRRRRSAAA